MGGPRVLADHAAAPADLHDVVTGSGDHADFGADVAGLDRVAGAVEADQAVAVDLAAHDQLQPIGGPAHRQQMGPFGGEPRVPHMGCGGGGLMVMLGFTGGCGRVRRCAARRPACVRSATPTRRPAWRGCWARCRWWPGCAGGWTWPGSSTGPARSGRLPG